MSDGSVGPRLDLGLDVHGARKAEVGNLGHNARWRGGVRGQQHVSAGQVAVYDAPAVQESHARSDVLCCRENDIEVGLTLGPEETSVRSLLQRKMHIKLLLSSTSQSLLVSMDSSLQGLLSAHLKLNQDEMAQQLCHHAEVLGDSVWQIENGHPPS